MRGEPSHWEGYIYPAAVTRTAWFSGKVQYQVKPEKMIIAEIQAMRGGWRLSRPGVSK